MAGIIPLGGAKAKPRRRKARKWPEIARVPDVEGQRSKVNRSATLLLQLTFDL
jgi:hypothetical protein